MKLKAIAKWEVKTGKNRGIYVAVTPEQAQKFYPRWGGLDHVTRYYTYKRHGIKEPNKILTTSIWARHAMRPEWEKVTIVTV